jgi:hypothetical protein
MRSNQESQFALTAFGRQLHCRRFALSLGSPIIDETILRMYRLTKEDLEKWISEIADTWSSSGSMGKVLMIFACIGASTTLTSLSGMIIEWRGLIAEMLSFYSLHVRDPIVAAINFLTFGFLRPVGSMVDATFLYVIYFSGEKRVIGRLREQSVVNASLFILDVIVLPIVLLSLLLFALLMIDRYMLQGVWTYASSLAISVPLLLICWSLYQWGRSLIWLSRGGCPEWLEPASQSLLYMRQIRDFIQFGTPIVVAFLVLAVLASINLGLT